MLNWVAKRAFRAAGGAYVISDHPRNSMGELVAYQWTGASLILGSVQTYQVAAELRYLLSNTEFANRSRCGLPPVCA